MPTHVDIDRRNGDLLVSDGYGNARIPRYSKDGRHLSSWGESGTDPGRFNIIHNIATDKDGRVQVFDPDGTLLAQWGNLSSAEAVCIDAAGERVYVREYFGAATTTRRAETSARG